MTLEREMIDYGVQEADAATAGAFIRACLHLDLDRRPSAEGSLRQAFGRRSIGSVVSMPL